MARPEIRINPGRRVPPMSQAAAAAMMAVASAKAEAQDMIDAAVSGDLIAASPALAAAINDIDARLTALEP